MHSWIQTPTLNWPKHQKRTQWHMFHWPGFVLSIHDERSQKKGCLKASMFFYFYPACFPTFCHLNPISGWLNHVNLQRLMVFTSILQAFMLVSQPPKSECWLMSIHLNQFQSIYIYMCVCVFQVKNLQKNLKNTTILPAFSPVSQAWGSSWATVSWRVRWRRRTRAVWRPKWQAPEMGQCLRSMGKMWWIWLIYG